MPAAVGLYWIFSSLFSIIQDVILNRYYGKVFAEMDAEKNELARRKEEELKEKREETERLRAENKTTVNPNTSKRKQQVKEREVKREKTAEWERIHNPAPVVEPSASQEGTRRYARGRAYDPNRYGNAPVEAAAVMTETVEAVEAAAEEATVIPAESVETEAPAVQTPPVAEETEDYEADDEVYEDEADGDYEDEEEEASDD